MNKLGNLKHGGCGTLTYARWKSMIARCHNPMATNFKYYGARGIIVCEQWRNSFEAFHKDMGDCPNSNMTLERINNDIGYQPENCTWATKASQNRNRSHCVPLTYRGETKILTEWAASVGISANALAMRIRLGWSVERALTQPLKKRTVK